MINIAAFTFKFDSVEDRILLVGNLSSTEPRIDYWLTRRLVMRLLNAMPDMLNQTTEGLSQAPLEHQAELAQFYHDNARQTLQVNREDKALSSDGSALLHRLDVSYRDGRYQLRFFGGGDEADAQAVLSYEEMHHMLHLLHKGAKNLDWGVSDSLFTDKLASQTLQ